MKYEDTSSNGILHLAEICNAHSTRPKMIVIDLDIPGIDGKKTLSEVRKFPDLKDIPVMFLSNNPEELDEPFLEKQHVSVLKKPFTLDGYNKIAETIIYSLL